MSSFISVTLLSTNIVQDIKKAALEQRVPVDSLDFDLLSYETSFKGSVDEEWHTLEGDILTQTTENEVRSPHFLLRQEYRIQIRQKKPHPYLDLHFTIATDKTKSKVIAVIEPSSKIPLKKGVQEWIKEVIFKKMLRHGLLIGLYDQNLDREINRLIAKIQKEGPLVFLYRMPIGEFFLPVLPINDKVILHFKNKNTTNSMIEGVNPGELILEYLRPKAGRDGRACSGEHIRVPEPIVKFAPYIVIDPETIESQEDEESIQFFAKVSGYVERKNGIFSISQELQIENASLRKTGSIETGMDKDISLKINKKVDNEDAVGMGVNIDVQTLDVKGTVGSNTKIQACEVTIGAQTHKKSFIEVEGNATIHLHRGNLKAKNATIDILEAGTVEAQTVHVKSMSGGEIIAQRVIIDVLYSNAKITALESIEIKSIVGDGNDLIINPRAIPSYLEQITVLEDELIRKQLELRERGKKYLQKELLLKEDRIRIQRTIDNINTATRQNREPLKSDKERLTHYKSAVESLKNEAIMIKAQEDALHAFERKLDRLYEADLEAVVTHNKTYDGNTRIQFIDPKTRKPYTLSPIGNITHVRLHKEGDEKKFFFES